MPFEYRIVYIEARFLDVLGGELEKEQLFSSRSTSK
jgi:hypothetical protein